MKYYPVSLDVRDRQCLVVGGGGVGARKVNTLLACGAAVTVVSPQITPALESLVEAETLTWRKRSYRPSDLSGMFLVIGATNDEVLNDQISRDAQARNMLCNIADRPAACNFILPSIVHRGDLVLAISTSGKSPAFAKRLRKGLEKQFGEEYTDFLQLMGAIREKLLATAHEPEVHKPLFEKLIDSGLLDRVRDRDTDGIDRLLLDVLGPGFDVMQLMPSLYSPDC